MSNARTLVALATYNEIGNLPSLVEAIRAALPTADVLIVDDNSPDGTGRWCDKQVEVDSQLKCLHRPEKQGLGSATLAAMRYAVENGYEVLVTMDADWSHDPQYLPTLVEAIEGADVVVGSRYCLGGAIEGWPAGRRVMSRGVNWLSRLLLRLPAKDMSGAFRVYRVDVLQGIGLENIRSTGYSYLEEILWHLHHAGAQVAEVPITFHERRAGRSKVSAREAVGKLSTLLRLRFVRR